MQEYTSTLTLGEVELDVRYVAQKHREEIIERCTRRTAGSLAGDLDPKRYRDEMADATIIGWRNLTPLDAFGWGYLDFEKLPTAAAGGVPYSQATARLLYRECEFTAFRRPIEEVSAAIVAELARQKKAAQRSSAGSPTPTD